jgi:hypothetical protein
LCYSFETALKFAPSADRHGISRAAAVYAIIHAVGREVSGREGRRLKVAYVGHPHAQTDRYIEIVVMEWEPRNVAGFHAMDLSDNFRHLAQ